MSCAGDKIFTRILQAHPESRVFHLTNPIYFLKSLSSTVRIGRRLIRGVRESYGQESPGRLLTLFGSSGYLEIACNLGSAAEMVGYVPGKVVEVKLRVGKSLGAV